MITFGFVSGSAVTMLAVGVAVYPFFHLGVKMWQVWRERS
jgi:hypothetical protein